MTGFTTLPPTLHDQGMLHTGPRSAVRRLFAWELGFFAAAGKVATEGLRLLRREPGAGLVWTGLWLAALLFVGIVRAAGPRVVMATSATTSLSEIIGRFGAFAAVSVPVLLLVWTTTTVAVYRAVLRPHDRGFFFLRVGQDELRLAVMTVASFILLLIFGGAPAYLLLVLASPFMRALPDMARDIGKLGALITVIVDIWLGVRLSLIAVETVAERRFHLTAYWPLARGRFWFLLLCYFFCLLMILLITAVFGILGSVALAFVPQTSGGGLLWRTGVWGLVAVWAMAAAVFAVLSTAILCACQAYAFGAIVADGKADVRIS
jgi:hypothetical protein